MQQDVYVVAAIGHAVGEFVTEIRKRRVMKNIPEIVEELISELR